MPYQVNDRVELHPGTDWWMRGARYGTIVSIAPVPGTTPVLFRYRILLDKGPKRPIRFRAESIYRVIDNPVTAAKPKGYCNEYHRVVSDADACGVCPPCIR